MAILNSQPNPKEVIFIQRNDNNTLNQEVRISGSLLVPYIDENGYVNADFSSSFYSKFPPVAVSVASIISSSWASQSLSSSYLFPETYQITSSWAVSASWTSQSLSSSYAVTAAFSLNGGGSGTTLYTGSTYPITSSWAQTSSLSISASWASQSLSSSYLFPGNYDVTSSWSNNATNASTASSIPLYLALNSAQTNVICHVDGDGRVYKSPVLVDNTNNIYGTSSWAINSINSATPVSVSWASQSLSSSYSSIADTASFATYGVLAVHATRADTASYLMPGTYDVTSSWAISASWASQSLSSSYLPVNTYDITSSWAINVVNGSNQISVSWASQSFSSSYSSIADTASFATYGVLAVHATRADTASYLMPGTYDVTSSWAISASWASQSLSSSYSNNSNELGGNLPAYYQPALVTGNTYNITSSWTDNAVSSSYALNAASISSSYSLKSSNSDNAISASWAPITSTPVSVSWASQSLSSSYLMPGNYDVTSSWAISASWAPITSTPVSVSWASQSLSSSYLMPGNYDVTSSWAISASWSPLQDVIKLSNIPFISIVTTGSLRNNYAGLLGFRFSASRDFQITALGRWVISGNNQIHAINLYNSGYTLVGSVNIDTTMSAGNTFLYSNLTTPLNITSGSNWFIESVEYNGGDYWYDYPTMVSVIYPTYGTVVGAALDSGNNPTPNTSYVPPNFLLKDIDSTENIIFNITTSNAISSSYSLTSSYVLGSSGLSSISSSWASQSLSSSYSSIANTASFATYGVLAVHATRADTASYLMPGTYDVTSSWAISASWASQSLSSSYSNNSNELGGNLPAYYQPALVTGNTYNITSSWTDNAVSSSYALNAASISSSYSLKSSNSDNAISASWAPITSTPVSVSWASQSLSSSYLMPGNYDVTSSWAISASWAPITSTPVSVSWASQSLSSSYLMPGNYDVTSSWAISASWSPLQDVIKLSNIPFISIVTTGSLRNNYAGLLGFRFSASRDFQITALGRWVISGNNQIHAINLYNSGYTLVGSVNIDTTMSAGNTFLYSNLTTPLNITSGSNWFIESVEYNGGDYWYDYPTMVSVIYPTYGTVVGAALDSGNNPTPNTSYVPPNFLLKDIDSTENIIFNITTSNAISSSYSLTSSYVLGSSGLSSISSSWASQSLSSSYSSIANTASFATYGVLAVHATRADTASYLMPGTYDVTSSWAISASWASQSLSSSYSNNSNELGGNLPAYYQPALVTGNTYNITSSWAVNVVNQSTGSGGVIVQEAIGFSPTIASVSDQITRSLWLVNQTGMYRLNSVLISTGSSPPISGRYNYWLGWTDEILNNNTIINTMDMSLSAYVTTSTILLSAISGSLISETSSYSAISGACYSITKTTLEYLNTGSGGSNSGGGQGGGSTDIIMVQTFS